MDSVRLPNRPPFSMTSLSIFPMASSMTCICSGVALFLNSGLLRKLTICRFTFCSSFFATLSRLPKTTSQLMVSFSSLKSSSDSASSRCRDSILLSFPFRLSFEDLRVYSRMMARRFCWYVPYSLL